MAKNKIIFIDSDGTMMDSMNLKHFKAFGPAFVKTFELYSYEKDVLDEWNRLNLFSETRGINRFDGCYQCLKFVNDNFKKIDLLDDLKYFLEHTTEKSKPALEEYIQKNNKPKLKKVIDWSDLTNKLIAEYKDEVKPFDNAKEALKVLAKTYTVIIISSANGKAIQEEWSKFGLIEYCTEVCTQEMGTKKVAISKMLKKYQPQAALMLGDALGDLDAANANAINFFPIKPKQENESWAQLMTVYIKKFEQNGYSLIQNKINQDFLDYLKSNN